MKTTAFLVNKADTLFNICLNADGYYVSVNHLFAQHFFIANTNIKDHSFFETISPDDEEQVKELITNCIKAPSEIFSCSISHLSGNINVEWRMSALFINNEYVINLTGNEVKNASDKTASSNDNSITDQHISTDLLYKFYNYSLDVICAIDFEGKFVAVSNACKSMWGYDPEELVGEKFLDFVHKEDLEMTHSASAEARKGVELKSFENRYIRKDGVIVPLIWTAKWSEEDSMMYCAARDGTRRKAYEDAIKFSEEKYKLLFYNNPQPMWIYDQETFAFLEVNDAAIDKYGYSREDFLSMSIKDIRPREDVDKLIGFRGQEEKKDTLSYTSYWRHLTKDRELLNVEVTAHEIDYSNHKAKLVLANDITKHVEAERELIKSNERYYYATKASFDVIWDLDFNTNEMYWGDSYEKLFGYTPAKNRELFSVWLERVHPEDRERVYKGFNEVLNENGVSWEDEYRFKKSDETYAYVIDRGIIIRNEENKAYRMIGVIHDYTEKQKSEQSLKSLNESLVKRASELASSNQELERFAYVASHDLQEPLRMVSSFLQLIQRKYQAQLDEKANEYIHFAVDGAERMKTLILDLLKYSRVNTMKEEHELVDLNEICKSTLLTYKNVIAETNAVIDCEHFPTILGTKTQLTQLFQNLIGNALKYKSNLPPHIKLSASEEGEYWLFRVEDNGIGIDPRFFEKIFIIFQRLHHKDEYSGTGIGLAICKKIVERHGGRIWVESVKGQGSIFYFTLKKNLQNQ